VVSTVTETTVLEAVLRRDRWVVVAALIAVIAVAWIWIVLGAGTGTSAVAMTQMAAMPDMDMMMERAVWTPGYAALIFAMWWAMMVAMMLPGATPMLLLFARVNRSQQAQDRPYVPTGIFAAGYLWQLTPIKGVCLRHCRSPLAFLAQQWRPGRLGAFRMGLEHGAYCLGCCWFLMGLLFFGGIMNLFWIAGLALFVLLEKAIPMGHWFGRIAGVCFAAWGVLMLASAAGGE